MTEPKFKRGDSVEIIHRSYSSFRVVGAVYDPSEGCYFYVLAFMNSDGWNIFITLMAEDQLTYSIQGPFDGPKVIS